MYSFAYLVSEWVGFSLGVGKLVQGSHNLMDGGVLRYLARYLASLAWSNEDESDANGGGDGESHDVLVCLSIYLELLVNGSDIM